MGTLLHQIFQRCHIPPDEVMDKPHGVRAFMLASMMATLEAEEKRRNGEEV